MMHLGLCLALGNNQRVGDPLPSMSFTTTPALQSLTAGDTDADVTNSAAIYDVANATPTADSVDWLVDGLPTLPPFTLASSEHLEIRYQLAGHQSRTFLIDASVDAASAAIINSITGGVNEIVIDYTGTLSITGGVNEIILEAI